MKALKSGWRPLRVMACASPTFVTCVGGIHNFHRTFSASRLSAPTHHPRFSQVLHCDEAVGRSGGDAPCRDDEMERRQFRCRAVFDRCFPHDGRHGAAMHDVFVHDFCDTIACGRPGEAGRGAAGRATLSGAAGPAPRKKRIFLIF